MNRFGRALKIVAAASMAISGMGAGSATAQSTFQGDVEAMKAEVLRRASINQYPVVGYDLSDIREGLGRIKSKDEDEWAAAWMSIGDRYANRAQAEEQRDPKAAASDYLIAHNWYALGHFPQPRTPGKRAIMAKDYALFLAFDRLSDLPARVLKVDTPQGQITTYLRLPKGAGPHPLLIHIGGLDGYKENMAMTDSLAYARNGVAMLNLDAPGTSQSVKASANAWQALLVVIDQVRAMPEIDRSHVVLFGGSWGGYWSTSLAFHAPDRFVGVVSQGAGVDRTFTDHLDELLGTKEYLFGMQGALETAFGIQTLAELRAVFPSLSLRVQGVMDKPTPPMLLVNGAKDTLFPVDDLLQLLRTGTAKEAWINPNGIHMGRETGVWDSRRIGIEVQRPWILSRLGVSRPWVP